MKNLINFLAIILLFCINTFGQVTVVATKTNATYYEGETMQFNITSTSGGTATYRFAYAAPTSGNNFIQSVEPSSVFSSITTVNLTANVATTVTPTLTQAGSIICEVTMNSSIYVGIAFNKPLDIQPVESEPTDFETFWKAQVFTARQLVTNFQILDNNTNITSIARTSPVCSSPVSPTTTNIVSTNSKTYRFKINTVDNKTVSGYISVPNGVGPFPAVIKLPGAGSAGIFPFEDYANSKGIINIVLNIHDVLEPNLQGPCNYPTLNADNNATNYFRHITLGTIRLIDYLNSPNLDSKITFDKQNLGIWGESQGGGLSLIIAGLDQFIDLPNKRIKAVSVSNPALCEHQGLLAPSVTKAGGWPNWVSASSTTALKQAVKYYDAVFFAKRIDKPIQMTIGFKDRVCQPSTNYTALNQIKKNITIFNMREADHVHPNEFWGGNINFFKANLSNSITNIDANFRGYAINANSTNINLNNAATNITLTASIKNNGTATTNLPVKWEVVSKPANATVTFGSLSTNSNVSYTPNIGFSATGTYILRLRAEDTYSLITPQQSYQTDKSFYTLIDYVTVTVGAACTITSPSVTASQSIACGSSASLTASCTTGTVQWSGYGSGVGTISVSPTTTTSYSATCTSTCTSAPATSTVTVTGTCGSSCPINFTTFNETATNVTATACPQNPITYDLNFTSSTAYPTSTDIIITGVPASQYLGYTCTAGGTVTDIYPGGIRQLKWTLPTISTGTTYNAKFSFCYVNPVIHVTATTSRNSSTTCDKLSGSGSGCTTPATPTLTASPTTISSGQSSTLTASTCTGGTNTFYNSSTNAVVTSSVSPTVTTSYYAKCTVGTCVSANSNIVQVTVSSSCTVTANATNFITVPSGVKTFYVSKIQAPFQASGSAFDFANNDVTMCKSLNSTARLATITNATENTDIKAAISNNGTSGNNYFIGYSNKTGSWVWNGGSSTFTPPGFTTTGSAANSAVQLVSYTPGWAINGINASSYFVCEVPCQNGSATRVGASESTGNEETEINLFTIYPNPTNDKLTVEYSITKDSEITFGIMDMTGKSVQNRTIEGKAGTHSFVMDVSKVIEGSYILRGITEDKSQAKKFVIIR
jgi:cephalosporin-C deacetylase